MKLNSQVPFHSLLPNEFLYLNTIEEADEADFYGQHRHQFYEILWFTEVDEKATHQIDFDDYKIEPNQLYIFSPNQVHSMNKKGKEGFILAFSKDFFHTVFEMPTELFLHPYFFHTVVDEDLSQILKQLIQLISLEMKGNARKKIVQAYCTALVLHISAVKQMIMKPSNRVIKILQLIDQKFTAEKEVSFYANAVNLSERRLNEICIKNTGHTVKQLLIDRTNTEAKRLLSTERRSIKQISYDLGFNDPAYFSRIFRRKNNITPEKYRKLFLK